MCCRHAVMIAMYLNGQHTSRNRHLWESLHSRFQNSDLSSVSMGKIIGDESHDLTAGDVICFIVLYYWQPTIIFSEQFQSVTYNMEEWLKLSPHLYITSKMEFSHLTLGQKLDIPLLQISAENRKQKWLLFPFPSLTLNYKADDVMAASTPQI